ncbi:MAG: flagellar export chaperone FliS [Clostridiales bacterium]|jgi:flagellar protein FliS|nr:flagellar export chaperone FliS [Clostridiales bacterium]
MAYSRLNKYQEQTILTMTPGEMVVRLFEESEKQLNIAMVCIDDKNIQGANNALQKAQRIFTYLKASLDFNYQLSENLSALYDFFNRRLVEANMKKSKAPVEEILPLVSELRDTFQQGERLARMA